MMCVSSTELVAEAGPSLMSYVESLHSTNPLELLIAMMPVYCFLR